MLSLFTKTLLLLLLLTISVNGVQYEIRGHIDIISKYDIDNQYSDDANFALKHEQASDRMAQIIGSDFSSFVIHDYKIHGLDTAVFHAHLNLIDDCETTRQDIIDKIVDTTDVQIYFLRQNEVELRSIERYRLSQDDVTSCYHGGVLLPNATCSCLPYYSGSQCEVVSCQNNGIGEKGRCICPPGIYSPHCESRTCVSQIESTVDFSTQSMILVINTRTSMAFDLSTIITNLNVLATDYQNAGVVLSNYIITIYRYSQSVYFMESNTFPTVDTAIDYLHSVAIAPAKDDQPTLDAIAFAQSTSIGMRPKSTVYVFADSENKDDTTPSTYITSANESVVIQQTLSWRNKIILVLSQWPDTPIAPSGNHFDVLRRVVTATHGDLLIVDKTELAEVVTLMLFYSIGGQNTFVQYYSNSTKTIPLLSDNPTASSYILLTCENGVSLPNVQTKTGATPKLVANGARYSLYQIQQSVTDSVSIVGDTIPIHSTRVWFISSSDVLVSYHSDDTVDNGYAHTFSSFDQRPNFYSSFPSTTALVVSRLDSFNSSIIMSASPATARSASCIFQFQSDIVHSCTPGPYVHNIQVTTSQSTYYRAVPGYCFTADSHSAPLWACVNNGTRSGASSCRCAANWQGLHCEVPVCQNLGTPDKFPNGNGHGNCICPFGVTGPFCDIMTCPSTSPDTFQSYNRSFAIVVQNSLSAAQALTKLNDGLVQMFKQNTSDFEDFVLTTFKSRQLGTSVVADVQSTKMRDVASFLAATTPENIGYTYSPAGSQPGLYALETTLRSMDFDKSSVFFFTDSASSVPANSMNYTDILQTVVERQIEVSIVIIPAYGSQEMCLQPADYEFYDILAKQSGGNFINLCQPYTANSDPIFNFIASYGSTHHHTEVVAYYSVLNCDSFTSDSFTLSSVTNDAYVVIYSPTIQSFDVSVVDKIANVQQGLTPDSHSVPFFGSYQIKVASNSSLVYSVTVKTGKNEPCFVRVTEKSQFAAYIGFSPNPSVDRYSKDLQYALHQQPVIHLSSTLQSEPNIAVSVYSDSKLVYYSSGTKRTSGCKYEYILDKQFVCDTAGDTFTMETTIATKEVTIMRTQRAYCKDLSVCVNGGLMLGGKCQCLNGYTSTYCEYPLCQNGGSVVDFKCDCPVGYNGDLCQYVECYDWNYIETHDPREYSSQQITFVVEVNTKAMVLANIYLQKNIESFMSITDNQQAPKQYTLVVFDDQTVRVVVSTTHKDVLLAAFQSGITAGTNTPTTVLTYPALIKAYSTMMVLPGTVFLFTATTPSKTSVVDVNRARFGIQTNVIYLGDDYSKLLQTNVDTYLCGIARLSGGRILPINSLNTPQMLTSMTKAVFQNQLILDDGAKDCTQGVSFSFPVGQLATSLRVIASGSNVVVTATDEKNAAVKLTSYQDFFDNNTIIYAINVINHNAGTWTVTLTSPSSCFIQARSVSPLQVIPKFTNAIRDDYGSVIPRVGAGTTKSSYMTYRLVDSYNIDNNNYGSTLDSIEAWTTDPQTVWDSKTLLSNTTSTLRNPLECSSQFVSQLLTWTGTFEKFVVRGKDSSNYDYQRTYFVSAQAQKTDCQNGATVDQYGFCTCDADHYGSLCELRKCRNGGISAYGLCDCPNGYYGNYCEQYQP